MFNVVRGLKWNESMQHQCQIGPYIDMCFYISTVLTTYQCKKENRISVGCAEWKIFSIYIGIVLFLTMCLFSFFATISVRKLTETVAYELDCCWKMFMNSIIIGFASSECLIWSSIVSLFLMLICVQYIYIRLVEFEYDSTYYGITHLVHWMRSKTPPHSFRLSSSADQIQSQICIASTNYTFLSTYLSQ